jgi:hypothetical protein
VLEDEGFRGAIERIVAMVECGIFVNGPDLAKSTSTSVATLGALMKSSTPV